MLRDAGIGGNRMLLHRSSTESPQTRQAMLGELQAGWRAMAARAHARGVSKQ